MMRFAKSKLRDGRPLRNRILPGALLVIATGLAQPALAAFSCSVSVTTPQSFGSYSTTSDSSSAIPLTVSCGGWGSQISSATFVLTASSGSGSYSGRQMFNGSNVITYNLYTTSGNTTIWGDGNSGTITFTGTLTKNSPSTTVTAYGLISGGQNVPPGSYTTTTPINVTLTYTF